MKRLFVAECPTVFHYKTFFQLSCSLADQVLFWVVSWHRNTKFMNYCLARRIVCTVFMISSFSAFENTLQFMLVFDVCRPNMFCKKCLCRKKTMHALVCAYTHTHTLFEVNIKCGVIFFHMFPWINIELFILLLFWDGSNRGIWSLWSGPLVITMLVTIWMSVKLLKILMWKHIQSTKE